MRVRDLMKHDVRSCNTEATLCEAARLMWEGDVGAVPIIDHENRPIGMITDRDICMAAMLNGVPLRARGVMTAMSNGVSTCTPEDLVADVEKKMQDAQVRRLPVVDSNGILIGIISLADLARHAESQKLPLWAPGVVKTLSAITERRWAGALAAAAE